MSPDHINHPYPSEKEKARMVLETGIELKRLNNWFVNNRIRYWKPRMEALQKEPSEQPSRRSELQPESKTRLSTEAAPAKPVLAGCAKASASSSSDTSNFLLRVAKSCPEVNDTVEGTPKLDLPTTLRDLVHEVSDASIATNDGSVSSSDEDQESGRDSHFSLPSSSTYDELVEIWSPPRTVQKRLRGKEDEDLLSRISSPRTKYRQKDIETWKTACETSPKLHDTSLPSLDEAACLFGYSSIIV